MICVYPTIYVESIFHLLHVKCIIFFSIAVGMILLGAIIYGSKNSDKIGWAFWFALTAAILALVNGIMWCMTQQMKRFIKGGAGGAAGGLGGSMGGGLDAGFGGDLGGGML